MLGTRDKRHNKKLIRKYLTRLAGNKVSCRLCPNNCMIPDDGRGLCNARANIDGKLYSMIYGYPCSINLDPIEKKPLYHFFPGQKILSIGTFGCNLFCKGCQNFDITRHNAASGTEELRYYTPEEIIGLALKNNVKMIAYTYNEPTIFFEYMIDIAKLARKHGIRNVIVSNGYINPEPLKELCRYIDAANIDLKGMTNIFYKKYCGVKLGPVLETIKYIHSKKGVWMELTNLLIPGLNDDRKDVDALCEWVAKNLGQDVPLHFSRFYPHYHASEVPPTPEASLNLARNIALGKGIKYVYIGNLGSLDNTYCNGCGSILIERDYNRSRITGLDEKNHCIKCGKHLPGMF